MKIRVLKFFFSNFFVVGSIVLETARIPVWLPSRYNDRTLDFELRGVLWGQISGRIRRTIGKSPI